MVATAAATAATAHMAGLHAAAQSAMCCGCDVRWCWCCRCDFTTIRRNFVCVFVCFSCVRISVRFQIHACKTTHTQRHTRSPRTRRHVHAPAPNTVIKMKSICITGLKAGMRRHRRFLNRLISSKGGRLRFCCCAPRWDENASFVRCWRRVCLCVCVNESE